jgi:hypothetical protein
MNNLKKGLRMLVFIILLLLAGIGIGLFGGVPAPSKSRRGDKIEVNKELKESDRKKGTLEKQ